MNGNEKIVISSNEICLYLYTARNIERERERMSMPIGTCCKHFRIQNEKQMDKLWWYCTNFPVAVAFSFVGHSYTNTLIACHTENACKMKNIVCICELCIFRQKLQPNYSPTYWRMENVLHKWFIQCDK